MVGLRAVFNDLKWSLTLNLDFNVTIDALNVLSAQLADAICLR